jgi:hypothetical protein
MKTKNHDPNLTNMVARAGRAFVAAKNKSPRVEGADLAAWLRSGAEIGPQERELLAELVTGVWRANQGRPTRKGPGHAYAQAVVSDLENRLETYGKNMSLAAKQDTAKSFNLSVRDVERYAQESNERKKALSTRAN